MIYTTLNKKEGQKGSTKENERAIEKLKEKNKINEDLFKEQLEILENDNDYLKREADQVKQESKERA